MTIHSELPYFNHSSITESFIEPESALVYPQRWHVDTTFFHYIRPDWSLWGTPQSRVLGRRLLLNLTFISIALNGSIK